MLGGPAASRLQPTMEALSELSNMDNSFLWKKASCSIPDLIWRLPLGWDAWFTSSMTLEAVPCRSYPSAVSMVSRHWARNIAIELCFHRWCPRLVLPQMTWNRNFVIGACCLVQIRWFPSYYSEPYVFPTLWNKVELFHWSYFSEGSLCCAHRPYRSSILLLLSLVLMD